MNVEADIPFPEEISHEVTPTEHIPSVVEVFSYFPATPYTGYVEAAVSNSEDAKDFNAQVSEKDGKTVIELTTNLSHVHDALGEVAHLKRSAGELNKAAEEKRKAREKYKAIVIEKFNDAVDRTPLTSHGKEVIKQVGERIYNQGTRTAEEGVRLSQILMLNLPDSKGGYNEKDSQQADSLLYRWKREELIARYLVEGETDELIEERNRLETWREDHINRFDGIEP